jgi:hypothetical protein
MKMKVLHYPEKGKIATFTNMLANEYQETADKIPPAYDCNRDRLLFMGISSGNMMDDALSRFLRGLDREKVQNVALFTDASDAVIEQIKEIFAETGINFMNVKRTKKAFLPFLTSVKPEEFEDLKLWAKGIMNQLID